MEPCHPSQGPSRGQWKPSDLGLSRGIWGSAWILQLVEPLTVQTPAPEPSFWLIFRFTVSPHGASRLALIFLRPEQGSPE